MQLLIEDSEYLFNVFNNLTEQEKNANDYLDTLLIGINNKELLFKLYEGNYNYNDNELLILLEDLRYLGCQTKIKEILILLKFNNTPLNKINKYLVNEYNDIILSKNKIYTFSYYDLINPFKYFIIDNNINNNIELLNFITEHDSINIFKYLITENIYNDKIFVLACEKNSYKIVIFLLTLFKENKINIDITYDNSYTLRIASENGHYETVKLLLLENGADIHARNDYALRYASNNNHYEIVKLLLENGANIHDFDDESLILASQKGYYDIVKLLIINGANIHTGDDYSLRWASHNGHYTVVKLLLENGANMHARKDIALIYASENGHYKIVKLLLENGEFINSTKNHALIQSSRNGHYGVIKLLLENGADINANNGSCALMHASRNGHYEVVKLLLENGADIHNILSLTFKKCHHKIVKLLESYIEKNE